MAGCGARRCASGDFDRRSFDPGCRLAAICVRSALQVSASPWALIIICSSYTGCGRGPRETSWQCIDGTRKRGNNEKATRGGHQTAKHTHSSTSSCCTHIIITNTAQYPHNGTAAPHAQGVGLLLGRTAVASVSGAAAAAAAPQQHPWPGGSLGQRGAPRTPRCHHHRARRPARSSSEVQQPAVAGRAALPLLLPGGWRGCPRAAGGARCAAARACLCGWCSSEWCELARGACKRVRGRGSRSSLQETHHTPWRPVQQESRAVHAVCGLSGELGVVLQRRRRQQSPQSGLTMRPMAEARKSSGSFSACLSHPAAVASGAAAAAASSERWLPHTATPGVRQARVNRLAAHLGCRARAALLCPGPRPGPCWNAPWRRQAAQQAARAARCRGRSATRCVVAPPLVQLRLLPPPA
jgi:hypothetical protein